MQTEGKNYTYRITGSLKEAERCLQCHNAPCTKGCPAGVDVKRFIGLVQKGEYTAAAAIIEKDNPLGLICGYICPSAQTCQKNCVSAKLGSPIDIRAIQAYTMELDRALTSVSHRPLSHSGSEIRHNDKGSVTTVACEQNGAGKVAVVGGGPAGLSAAWYLKEFGYEVSIFEASDKLGGRLVQGIPSFRVEPEIVEKEVSAVVKGMDIQLGKRLGQDFTAEGLLEQGYRGVILAIGKYESKRLPIEGADKPGVYDAEQILNEDAWKAAGHKEAVVIGAGNVAVDVARTLVRNGVEKVSICYRGGNLQVKAIQEEREEAYQDNVTWQLYAVPAAVEGENAATGVRFHRSHLVTEAGKRPVPTAMNAFYDFTVPADMVVFAVGYGLCANDLADSKVAVKNGVVETNAYATGVKGVYAAGDAIGGQTAVEAVGNGKAAALALHEYLKKEEQL